MGIENDNLIWLLAIDSEMFSVQIGTFLVEMDFRKNYDRTPLFPHVLDAFLAMRSADVIK